MVRELKKRNTIIYRYKEFKKIWRIKRETSSKVKEIKKRYLKEKMIAKKSVLKLENTEPKELY